MNKNDDVWGCPYCRSTLDIDNVSIIPAEGQKELFWEDVFPDTTDMLVQVGFGSLCIGFGVDRWKEPLNKSIKINFCPMCGRRIAEEHK